MKQYPIIALFAYLYLFPLNLPEKDNKFGEDFLKFWTDVKNNYAYFDKKVTDWEKVKTLYLPLAEKASNEKELITVFEHALEELYDNHFSLNTNLQTSTRLVPTGLDIWAEYVNDRVIITEVRKSFSADRAGIKPGMEIISINGEDIDKAVNARIGKCIPKIDTEVKNYALRQVLAGTYVSPRVLEVKNKGKISRVNIDQSGNLADNHQYTGLLESRILKNNIGYIKINNSLGDTDLIARFDSALANLKDTKGLILDLRETPSGGNSVVARGIMSRFITTELPFQKHVLPNEEKETGVKRSWVEMVTPRGPFTFKAAVVVLVNHWTASMGEGIAIGFDGFGKAKIVGTRMAGLIGAINGFRTTHAKIPFSFPIEQLYHVNGTPRELYKPRHLVDLTDPKYQGIDDPILSEGIKLVLAKK